MTNQPTHPPHGWVLRAHGGTIGAKEGVNMELLGAALFLNALD
jgi:hypothetical protein